MEEGNQKLEYAKKNAVIANQLNMEIGKCMISMEENNKDTAEFPMQFIAFAEKIIGKLDDTEAKLLTHLSGKAIACQKASTENFKLILDLAEQQRQRTEVAIKEYESIVKDY